MVKTRRGRLSVSLSFADDMTTLDMTGRLGSTLHGYELDRAYAGETDARGRRHGYGAYRFPNAFFTYRGDFREGVKHGRGRLEFADGGYYEGPFVDDEIQGEGERVWADGRSYAGGFELGEMHGEGVYRLANGSVYEGPMRHNAREGRGRLTTAEGNTYDGDWIRDKRHGAGVETIAATGERYEGDFADDSRHGVGASRNDAGDSYQGEFRNGRRHGVGEARDAVSGVTYVGPHVDDLPVHLPVELEIESLGPPDEEGGPPVRLGSEDAPVRATAGEALPAGAVVIRARLPREEKKPDEAKEGGENEDGAEEEREEPAVEEPAPEVENDAGDADEGESSPRGEVATHESGRVFRCSLHVGPPKLSGVDGDEGDATEEVGEDAAEAEERESERETPLESEAEGSAARESDDAKADASAPTWTYGEEIPLAPGATPLTFDAVFTVEGVASLDTVALREDVSPGAYTLKIADATPGKYGALSRCGEGHVVLEVAAAPGAEGEGVEEEGEGGGDAE